VGRGDASQRGGELGCQTVNSSRVPANGEQPGATQGEESSSSVPVDRTGRGRRNDQEEARQNRPTGHGRGVWADDET